MKSYEERTEAIMKKADILKKVRARRKKIAGSCMSMGLCLALMMSLPMINGTPGEDSKTALGEIQFAKDYSQVYGALSGYLEKQNSNRGGAATGDSAVTFGAAPESSAVANEQKSAAMDTAAGSGGSSDYSQTNVQVEGVDEGDIVKTDGEYIYSLKDYEVRILKADGENTKEISTIEVVKDPNKDGEDKNYYYDGDSPFEMYINGDILAVLIAENNYSIYRDAVPMQDSAKVSVANKDTQKVSIAFYDISDPAKPVKKGTAGQDGYNLASRMIDGKIYLVSNYFVYSASDESKPEQYVPCLYTNGKSSAMDAKFIAIMPEVESTRYTVVSVYDMETGAITSSQSVLDGGSDVYMNHNNLYVAQSKYNEDRSDPRTEGQYQVTDVKTSNTTSILRFDVSGGNVNLEAEGAVSGSLNDQFSMDEYDGYLRVVATIYEDNYTEYVDKAHDWTNYDWGESVNYNNLYVLNENMETTGSIENLAKDEVIYSARFDGTIGYFVTFRTVDPLFSVDLSDPQNPQILGQLKIPGFSDYLHVYADGRLFGLGQDADEKTGRTEGLKLSMFDVSDPTNVVEKHKLSLDESWSEATYNHKAILISKDKNIIAFPAADKYLIYGYDEASGFYLKGEANTGEMGYNSRGLYIGDYAYIVSYEKLVVLDMKDFDVVKKITF